MLLQALRGPSSGIPIHSVLLACFVDEFYVLLFKVCFENLLKLPKYFREYFKILPQDSLGMLSQVLRDPSSII